MSNTPTYPQGVPVRTARPRNAATGALIGGLFGLLLSDSPQGALAGGIAGAAMGNTQPSPLNLAVRAYFTQQGYEVIGFYRLGRYAIKVLFQHENAYWTVISQADETFEWNQEALDDWLYGDLIDCQLPAKLHQIQNYLPNENRRVS